ncbi:hypothetical protein [Magnetospirillum molischianum]|uniref:Uncharacterized protein n=1 Tax=Magnetospirillum molischianum DSM 120 TaxID=1150626 RepID=H8FMS5_MAGML|nr:hypothetical protein [Magnetospirillum molischianum]CCG39663.1 conserved exported hypothetical protein [Magnetospirillum molischianum DSM 120]
MSGYRVSFIRSSGWTRLGLAGGVLCLFLTPMLWSFGLFGDGDVALRRAIVFALSGTWLFGLGFFLIGWALQGFVIRVRTSEDEDDHHGAARPSGSSSGHPPAAGRHAVGGRTG